MNPVGVPSSSPLRPSAAGWPVLLLNAGYFLLVAGLSALVLSVFSEFNPLFVIGVILFSALVLFPLRDRLLRRTKGRLEDRTVPRSAGRSSSLDAVPAAGSIPMPVSEFAVAALISSIQEKFSPARIDFFQLRADGSAFVSPTSEAIFPADGELTRDLTSRGDALPIAVEPPADKFGDRARLFSLGARVLLPFFPDGVLAGFLALGPRGGNAAYSEDDLILLRSFADSAFTACADIGVSSPDSMEVLLQLAATIHATTDLDLLAELLFTQTARRIPLRAFRIALADEPSETLTYIFYAEDGRRCSDREGIPFSIHQDLAGEVVRTGTALWAADYSEACRVRKFPQREPPGAWGGVPLPAGASVAGAILLLRDLPFGGDERRLVESIAAHAGPAIVRARLQSVSARRTALMQTLERVSQRILATEDLEPLLDTVVAGAEELFPCQAALLLRPDPSGAWVVARGSGPGANAVGITITGPDHPLVSPPTADRPVAADSLAEDDPLNAAMEKSGAPFFRTYSFPLRRRENILGWIVLWNPASSLSVEDGFLLGAFAALSVDAMETVRLSVQTDRSLSGLAEELTSLQHLDQELNSASDTFTAMAITLDWAVRHTESSAGLAAMFGGEDFEVAAAFGYPNGVKPEIRTRLPLELSGLKEASQTGKPVLRRKEGTAPAGLLPGGKESLTIPIRRNAQTIGALVLESLAAGAFPPASVEFLERLASQAAIAISNTQLYTEVRNANQTKSEFISFVAHELKTPMTSIRGYTDLLAQGAVGPVNQTQTNFLSTIRVNVDRMAALVSDLNDISRIESGRLKLEFAAVPLTPALDEVLEALRSQIDAKEQKLTLEIPADLPPVWVDRGRLVQILTNLVSNAHKYTPSGGWLRICAERSTNHWDPIGPPDVVHVLVQDSGLGISLQEQKNIFQKFFRSEDRSVRDLPGTGLGLHITRNLVEMQGGKIWFESQPQSGSTFHFTVPVASV